MKGDSEVALIGKRFEEKKKAMLMKDYFYT